MVLSIIIPVYNAEKYLTRCLGSIFTAVAFSKVKTEVILIDNDSSDNSVKIAQEFASESPMKVTVLHCHTPGASAVRNYGVKKAAGKYIWFIDADDTISKNSIKLLTNKAESSKADIVMMGATRIYSDGHTDYLSAVNASSSDYKSRFVRYGAGPWQFIFSRKWWDAHGFLFKEGIIHEDMEMISSLILYTDHFASVDKPLYDYYQNDDSVLHKLKWDPHYLDIFTALSGLYARFEKMDAVSSYYGELEWFFIWNLLIDSAADFSKFREGKIGFRKSREMLSKYFPNWRKNRFLSQKSLKLRIRVRTNYYK